MTNIRTIDPKTLKKWLGLNEVVLIDVRESLENKLEKIQGSKNIPLTKICANDIILPEHKNKKIVIHCRSGTRSMTACEKISSENPDIELWNLEGGILAWIQEGFPTEKDLTTLSLDRQLHITLGLFILLGVILTHFVSYGLILLPTIIGLGLLNAGITGWCGMSKLLALFPWNRSK